MALCRRVDGNSILKHLAKGGGTVVASQQLFSQAAAIHASLSQSITNGQFSGSDLEAAWQDGSRLGWGSVHARQHTRQNDHDEQHRHQRSNREVVLIICVEKPNCNGQKKRNQKSNEQGTAAFEEAGGMQTLQKLSVEGVVSKPMRRQKISNCSRQLKPERKNPNTEQRGNIYREP